MNWRLTGTQMVPFPMTFGAPKYLETTPFSSFCATFHIFVNGDDTLQIR